MKKFDEQGIAVVLSMLVLTSILAIALNVAGILITELRLGSTAGHAIPAFFAADSGIEKVLMTRDSPIPVVTTVLGNQAEFTVTIVASTTPPCLADDYCVKSSGKYLDTQRSIEVTY